MTALYLTVVYQDAARFVAAHRALALFLLDSGGLPPYRKFPAGKVCSLLSRVQHQCFAAYHTQELAPDADSRALAFLSRVFELQQLLFESL